MTDTSDKCKQFANSLDNALLYAPNNIVHVSREIARQLIDVLNKASEELEQQDIVIREQTHE